MNNNSFKKGLNKIINIISNEKNQKIKLTTLAIKILQNFVDDLLKRIINQAKHYNSNILTPSSIQKSIMNDIFSDCPELSNVISLQCMTCISRVSSILENNNKKIINNNTNTISDDNNNISNNNNNNKINLNNIAGLNLSISYIISIIKSIDSNIKIVDLSPIVLTAISDTILFELCELSIMESLNNNISNNNLNNSNNVINSNNLIISIKKDQELSKILNIKKDYKENSIIKQQDSENNNNNNYNEYINEDYYSDQEMNESYDFEVKE